MKVKAKELLQYQSTSFLSAESNNPTEKKMVREKSRECHNHKPQPFPDPKRKRKPTNLNKHKPNKRTKSTKISSFFPKRGNRNTKRTEKHKNNITHGKTYNKSPCRTNHKATKSKTNKVRVDIGYSEVSAYSSRPVLRRGSRIRKRPRWMRSEQWHVEHRPHVIHVEPSEVVYM